jgi:lambda family phage portal protein
MLSLAGSYVGASTTRRSLSHWNPFAGSPDSDLTFDLKNLRSRSRDLIRNSPLASGAVATTTTNVIGSGLKLQSHIDADLLGISEDEASSWETNVERHFRLWADSTECDAARTISFADIQDLVFRQVLENGDVFVLLPRIVRPGSPYSIKIQIIEADRVCNRDSMADTDTLSAGVEHDRATGAPVAYHIMDQHPGNLWRSGPFTWRTVPAFGARTGIRNVLHLYRQLRPGQSRGVPYLAPVIESIKQLDRYSEAELMAAVISGMFTVFIKSDSGDTDFQAMALSAASGTSAEMGRSSTTGELELGNGAILSLAAGEEIQTANPNRPNTAYEPFVLAIVRQIGAALEIPYEVLVKQFNSSYSASRAAMLEAWRFYRSRREWLANAFCQMVYEAWLYEAVAMGRIAAPGYFADPLIRKAYCGAKWVGSAPTQIDPVKEVLAAEKRINLCLTTRDEETVALTGGDFEENFPRIRKEIGMLREIGMWSPPLGGQPSPSGSRDGSGEAPDRTTTDKEDEA